jgi:hypothetical protein
MSQRLSHLEKRQREMHTSMGLETPSPSFILLQRWMIYGLGTATPKKMTMTMRSKKHLSEDFAFPSLFLVLDAKGEKKIYLFSYFFFSDCNIRLSTCLV